MKRALALVLATMLLAALVPAATASAQASNDRGTKVTICHNVGHHPVTISVAKAAVPAHLRHGDTLGACKGQTPRPKPTTPTTCAFDARDSAYYNGPTNAAPLFATGPIYFSWTIATGAVTVPGGSWTETTVSPVVTYFNLVNSGTVLGTGAVNLAFTRTVPDAASFSFSGTLVGNVLSGTTSGTGAGLVNGALLTATGTTRCHPVEGDQD